LREGEAEAICKLHVSKTKPKVKKFEEEWAAYCGSQYSVGVNSGTDALMLALKALNVGDGDEVIIPANTFIATAEQPRHALDLYNAGADYVIIPHHLGGKFISTVIEAFGTQREKYKQAGKDHYKELKRARTNSNFL